jgi:hypothetical protein
MTASFVLIVYTFTLNVTNQHIAEDGLIFKRFAFQYVNNYIGLLYVTFYLQDMDRLRSLLGSQLITGALINNFAELYQSDAAATVKKMFGWVGKASDSDETSSTGDDSVWVGKCLDNDLDR